MDFFGAADSWVALSFLVFVLALLYLRIPKMVADALDSRAQAIAKELEEAARLREEAQELLATYQRQQREAEKEVEDILEQAKREAELLREEGEATLSQLLARRTKMAEQRIEQAEAAALKEVKAVAADAAVEAARQIIAERLTGDAQKALIDASIADVGKKLH